MKTWDCIGCGNLVDEPGDILCNRCRIKYTDPPKKFKVLVIDDDVKVLIEFKKELDATLYYEVVTAYDGRKGLEKIRYERPHLIVCDMMMPVMNGFTFVEKLRADNDPKLNRIPVIIMAEKKKMKDFFETVNIQGFILKPVNIQELLALLKKVISEQIIRA